MDGEFLRLVASSIFTTGTRNMGTNLSEESNLLTVTSNTQLFGIKQTSYEKLHDSKVLHYHTVELEGLDGFLVLGTATSCTALPKDLAACSKRCLANLTKVGNTRSGLCSFVFPSSKMESWKCLSKPAIQRVRRRLNFEMLNFKRKKKTQRRQPTTKLRRQSSCHRWFQLLRIEAVMGSLEDISKQPTKDHLTLKCEHVVAGVSPIASGLPVTKRSISLKVKRLLDSTRHDELLMATEMKLRKEGKRDSAALVKELCFASTKRALFKYSFFTKSAAFSPIIIVGAFVFPVTTTGIIEASATLSPSTPYTLSSGSTTAIGSVDGPILHVPEGWYVAEKQTQDGHTESRHRQNQLFLFVQSPRWTNNCTTIKSTHHWPFSEPIERRVFMGAEYNGELVTDGLENMDCGVVQAVEGVGVAACASAEERYKGTEQYVFLIKSEAFSPIIIVGAFVFPVTTTGIIEASATLSPSTPYTFSSGSITAIGSVDGPILHVPEGWYVLLQLGSIEVGTSKILPIVVLVRNVTATFHTLVQFTLFFFGTVINPTPKSPSLSSELECKTSP
uniref:Uncharacterized protein n=1 Tax=Timema douglasi TaxID=61478 RepID=A0A7R8VHQ3_TIMDO|nr:unnamed protein product [Timema douglasi]